MSELALKLIAENKAKHARGEDARVLDLGNCGLTEMPKEALECVWVETLILSAEWYEYDTDKKSVLSKSQNTGEANKIQALPAEIKRLKQLRNQVHVTCQFLIYPH